MPAERLSLIDYKVTAFTVAVMTVTVTAILRPDRPVARPEVLASGCQALSTPSTRARRQWRGECLVQNRADCGVLARLLLDSVVFRRPQLVGHVLPKRGIGAPKHILPGQPVSLAAYPGASSVRCGIALGGPA